MGGQVRRRTGQSWCWVLARERCRQIRPCRALDIEDLFAFVLNAFNGVDRWGLIGGRSEHLRHLYAGPG